MRCLGNLFRSNVCLTLAGLAAGLGLASSALADGVVYDQMTGVPSSAWFAPSSANNGANPGPALSGNRYMGVPVIFPNAVTNRIITGFDGCFANATGATLTLDAAGTTRLRLRYWIWNRFNNAGDAPRAYGPYTPPTPAGTGIVLVGLPAADIVLNNNQFLAFTAGTVDATTLGAPGTTGAIPVTPNVTVTQAAGAAIGLTFNWQISTDSGTTWADTNGATSIITGGATAPLPATGTNAFGAPNFAYFRSPDLADMDGTGSFLLTSGRQIGANSGVCVRVYVSGTVLSGACCNSATGSCIASTSGQPGCAAGQTYQGDNTTCGVACVTQACCSSTTGYCAVTGTNPCPTGLTAVGPGSSCTPNPCITPINDDCSTAIVLSLNVAVLGNNSNVTADGGTDGPPATCAFGGTNQFNKAVWFSFTAPATTNYEVSMCGTPFDSVLSVCTGTCASLTELACDDDTCVGGETSPGPGPGDPLASDVASVAMTAGTTYKIRVAAWATNGAGGNYGVIARYVDAASVGRCCTGASCALSDAANCPAGSTFAAGGVCSPNPCAPAGVCCRGATCSTAVAVNSAATCTGSLIGGQTAGAAFPTAAACNGAVISNSPCCYANYDKINGITVNDIFAFLADWFAGSPYANTGGTGAPTALAVQNIFDFLTNWFNGGCS